MALMRGDFSSDTISADNDARVESLHHAIIPPHDLRSHGGGFACLPFPFFWADQLTAILLPGLTNGRRGQHDRGNRADDCVIHIAISPVLCPLARQQALSVIADCSMMVLCNTER